MLYSFDFGIVLRFVPFLVQGIRYTLLVTVLALAFGLVIGMAVAILRLTRIPFIGIPLSLYVDLFRSLPELVFLFWMFYAVPILTGFHPSPVLSASLALGVSYGAGASEMLRGGILSLSGGQWEAAFALGMSTSQAYRRVILPQAIVRMLPPLISSSISLIKASSLASAVGVTELMWQGNALMLATYRRVETYTVIAVVFFVCLLPLVQATYALERRLGRSDA